MTTTCETVTVEKVTYAINWEAGALLSLSPIGKRGKPLASHRAARRNADGSITLGSWA